MLVVDETMSDMDLASTLEEDDKDSAVVAQANVFTKQDGRNSKVEPRKMVDITRDKPIKVTIRVVVPVRDHPKFNFVGKLLGPKGNSLKRLQEETMTKMAILGRGSMRDRHKEDELRKSGDPKFAHLMDDLHVEITSYAPPAEAHARIAYALAEVRRFLVPDYNDEIRQEQMWEMHVINSGKTAVSGESECSEDAGSAHSSRASTSPSRMTQSTDVTPPGAGTTGRKRPLLPGTRPTMSPTKRTVLSILARARAAQAKEIGAISRPLSNGRQFAVGMRTSGLIAAGADLVIN